MDASFCVAKETASALSNKRLQNSEDFRRHKIHSSHMDASFCVIKAAASVFPNKRLQNLEDFRRHKIYFSPFLLVRYFGSNESLYHNRYLQGSGSNIVDFAIKLTKFAIRGVQSAARKPNAAF